MLSVLRPKKHLGPRKEMEKLITLLLVNTYSILQFIKLIQTEYVYNESLYTHRSFFKYNFYKYIIYLFVLGVLDLCYSVGFSLVGESGSYSLDVVHGPLRLAASLVVEHELSISGLWSTGSTIAARRLSCIVACRIFPDQESNPCLLHWQVDSSPLCHQGIPTGHF